MPDQVEKLVPLDLLAALVADELQRRQDRLFARRHKQARFRDPDRALDSFDFDFNKKMNRALIYDLATARFVRRDVKLMEADPSAVALTLEANYGARLRALDDDDDEPQDSPSF